MTEDAPKSVSVGGVGEPREARASFAFLLGTLLLIMLTDPVFGRTRAGAFAMTAAFSAVLLTGVYAVSDSRGHLLVGLGLAVPATVLEWVGTISGSQAIGDAGSLLLTIFLVFTTFAILRHVVRARRITANVIFGAACVYLLVALVWGVAYYFVERFAPGSFAIGKAVVGENRYDAVFMYYSISTLTTLGYGDIIPVSATARSLAGFEALVGQFYIAILVARLVGIQIAQSFRDLPPTPTANQ